MDRTLQLRIKTVNLEVYIDRTQASIVVDLSSHRRYTSSKKMKRLCVTMLSDKIYRKLVLSRHATTNLLLLLPTLLHSTRMGVHRVCVIASLTL